MRESGLLAWYLYLIIPLPPSNAYLQVTEFMAYQLLTNYGNSTEIKSYVEKYDFYIFPVVNPDGKPFTTIACSWLRSL